MDQKDYIRKLRELAGMSRPEFCNYFGIPKRTVEDWEAGKRRMADYLLRLIEYKLRMEGLIESKDIIE